MNGTPWAPADIALLRKLYPDHPTAAIARQLGCTVQRAWAKASALGLHKSPAFLASAESGRIRRGQQHPNIVANYFQPGHTTWNAGVKGSTGHHPNTVRTQFKPGSLCGAAKHNYVPIGTLRINADGILERKVTDDRSIAPARRWVAEQRLVWEAAHGPIPARHLVVFKPGMRTAVLADITADRLDCISRADNARRNSLHNKPPELARLYQIKGAITRQVNRIAREAEERAQP